MAPGGMKLSNWGIPDRAPLTKIKGDYTLYCDLCGAEIVKIEKQEGALVISSPLRRFAIKVPDLEQGIRAIEERDLAYLHKILQEEDGLDFYYPECDKLYCEKHYLMFPKWDGDFYDYTDGKCPEGHVRIVDD